MFYSNLNNRCIVGLLLANSAFAGTMGDANVDAKRYFFSVTPIYGAVSDESINRYPYVETVGTTNNDVSHMSQVDDRWGYTLAVGYQFGPGLNHDLVLDYTNLRNHGTVQAVNSNASDIMINKMSQIARNEFALSSQDLSTGGVFMYGPASASMDSHYNYQTANLITHRNFQSSFLSNVKFSRYYGIKAAQLKKGFTAQYSGTGLERNFNVLPITDDPGPIADQINYEAKYFGIGPRVGMGADWSFARYFSVVGDLSFSLLGGSYKTEFVESLSTPLKLPGVVLQTPAYSFSQTTNNTVWTTGVLGANLGLGAHFDMRNSSTVGIEGGISSEQYWTEAVPDAFSSKRSNNSVSINQRFSVRNLYIKLSYLA